MSRFSTTVIEILLEFITSWSGIDAPIGDHIWNSPLWSYYPRRSVLYAILSSYGQYVHFQNVFTHMNALSNGKSSRILWESSSFWAYLFCQVTIMFVCLSIEAWSSSWEKSFYCYHRVRLKRVQDLFKAVFMPHNQFINWENGFKWDCFISQGLKIIKIVSFFASI